jgi:hypothetical protein
MTTVGVQGATKSFGRTTALDGVDLEVVRRRWTASISTPARG